MKRIYIAFLLTLMLTAEVKTQSESNAIIFDYPSEITTSHVIDSSVVVGYVQDGGWGVKSVNLETAEVIYEVVFSASTWSPPRYLFKREESLHAILADGLIRRLDVEDGEQTIIDSLWHLEGDRHSILHVFKSGNNLKALGTSTQGPVSLPNQRWYLGYSINLESLSVERLELPSEFEFWGIKAIKSIGNDKLGILYSTNDEENNESILRVYDSSYLLEDSVTIDGKYSDFSKHDGNYFLVGSENDWSKIVKISEEGIISTFYEEQNQTRGAFVKLLVEDEYIYGLRNWGSSPFGWYTSFLTLYQFEMSGMKNWEYTLETIYEFDLYPGTNGSGLVKTSLDEVIVLGNYFTDVATDSRGFAQWINTVLVRSKDVQLKELKVYPNPVYDQFYIGNSESVIHVKVMDTSGKILISTPMVGNAIDVSGLPAGYYMVLLRTTEQIHVYGLVKN